MGVVVVMTSGGGLGLKGGEDERGVWGEAARGGRHHRVGGSRDYSRV